MVTTKVTMVVVALLIIAMTTFEGSLPASVAVNQLEDSRVTYSLSESFIANYSNYLAVLYLIELVLMGRVLFFNKKKGSENKDG